MRHFRQIWAALLAFTAFCAPAMAAADKASWTLIVENDSFLYGDDLHYTNGFELSWASAEVGENAWPHQTLAGLANAYQFREGARLRYGFTFEQSIFTPENLRLTNPDPRDRPYAGWLNATATVTGETDDVLDRASLTLGVIGPAALGKLVQNTAHHIGRSMGLGAVLPQGWAYQLKDEPGFIVTRERKWRYWSDQGAYEVDMIPEAGIALGNIFTYANFGGMVRIGQGLKADWGPPRVQPGISGSDFIDTDRVGGFGWYAFAGLEGRAVARNIFLDGNSFVDSRHVSKYPYNGDLTAGVAMLASFGRASVSYTRRSREFDTQRSDDEFISIALTGSF